MVKKSDDYVKATKMWIEEEGLFIEEREHTLKENNVRKKHCQQLIAIYTDSLSIFNKEELLNKEQIKLARIRINKAKNELRDYIKNIKK